MRKIRDVLRLHLGERLSLRQVSLSLAIPHTTVTDYVRRARDAGITSWPLPEELSGDAALEARLFSEPAISSSHHREPDFEMMKRELARKGMTLVLHVSEIGLGLRGAGRHLAREELRLEYVVVELFGQWPTEPDRLRTSQVHRDS